MQECTGYFEFLLKPNPRSRVFHSWHIDCWTSDITATFPHIDVILNWNRLFHFSEPLWIKKTVSPPEFLGPEMGWPERRGHLSRENLTLPSPKQLVCKDVFFSAKCLSGAPSPPFHYWCSVRGGRRNWTVIPYKYHEMYSRFCIKVTQDILK